MTMAESEQLRIFPLNVVLFPGGSLSLHIFEERYKLMIGECLEETLPFGVVMIKKGPEVGGPATTFDVGTTAHIIKAERLDEGRYNIQTVGKHRFIIREVTAETPYLKATIEYLEDLDTDNLETLTEKARGILSEYLKTLTGVKGGWVKSVDTPIDPTALSYTIARSVAYPPMVGQYLLQLSSIKERIERSIPLLSERLLLAKSELEKRTSYKGPRLN